MTRNRRFIRTARGVRFADRVCRGCRLSLGARFTCPSCGEPTELVTATKTGPFTVGVEPKEGTP